jgi:hypothetical protein
VTRRALAAGLYNQTWTLLDWVKNARTAGEGMIVTQAER